MRPGTGSEKGAAKHLIVELADRLAADDITHCLWRGTTSIDAMARGQKDVDLLVAREDYAAFIAILGRLGFKEAYTPARPPTAVHHYYGHDSRVDRLVHVHSSHRLLLGSRATGVYHLPFADLFLTSADRGELFPVPPAELEALAFVVRMILWQSPDRVLIPFGRRPALPTRRRRELKDLVARACPDRVRRLVEERLPGWEASTFDTCVRVLGGEGTPEEARRCWGQTLRAVQPWPHRSRTRQVVDVVWHRGLRAASRLTRRSRPKRRLVSGGAMIAFVGGDGAGKSTAIGAVIDWLGPDLDVVRLHFGRPRWSWTTRAVRGGVGLARRLAATLGRPIPKYDKGQRGSTRYSVILRHVCTARDRYRHYRHALRAAQKGTIVICDRFPTSSPISIDGPMLSDMLVQENDGVGRAGRLRNYLAQLEAAYYERVGEPDVRIVLRLDPDIAVDRKAEEGVDWVRSRNRDVWIADWGSIGAEVVDSSRPVTEVHRAVRECTWAHL